MAARKAVGGSLIALAGSGAIGAYFLRRQHRRGMIDPNVRYAPQGSLTIPTRQATLDRLKRDRFDVLVIGGGATGTGVAVDCATRGLKCALIEENDFGAGTSSKSTKLIHGGIRYLEQAFKDADFGQLALVSEGLEERAHMLKAFPHAASALPIVMPIYKWWQVPYFWAGVVCYELIGKFVTNFDSGVPESFLLNKANALHYFPNLKRKGLKAAIVYYDGQHNDSRSNVALAMTAAAEEGIVPGTTPAAVINHCEVVDLLKDQEKGEIVGALVKDHESGEQFEVFGKVTVNCTGPGADRIRKLADPEAPELIAAAAGTHLVVKEHFMPEKFGLIIPKTSDGRVLFVLPWEQGAVIGTTDQKVPFTKEPEPTQHDVDFICKEVASCLSDSAEDLKANVTSVWRGLRPLVSSSGTKNTKKISRSHDILLDKGGLVSLVGGKWTTYRRMAQDVVDDIVLRFNLPAKNQCRTKQMRVLPAVDPTGKRDSSIIGSNQNTLACQLQRKFGIGFKQASYLVRNYGFGAEQICADGKKSGELTSYLVPHQPFSLAEVRYAVQKEMACTVEDIIARRVRIGFVDSSAAEKCLTRVADVLADELKWTESRKQQEIANGKKMIQTQLTATA